MENTFNKVRDYILENGNSNFRKIDKSFSTKFKLETLNTMLLLEEKNDISKITMSFFIRLKYLKMTTLHLGLKKNKMVTN